MSERAPYSRIYHSIVDDPKFSTVYDDDRRLATWLRLLIVAEQAHPASAYIPEGTNRNALAALAECGLIDIGTGRRFRIHGLDAERGRRAEAARVGGLASGRSRSIDRPASERGTSAERSLNGRGTETNLDETSIDEHRRAVRAQGANERSKNTVQSDPLLREMSATIREKYGDGMDAPAVEPIPLRKHP